MPEDNSRRNALRFFRRKSCNILAWWYRALSSITTILFPFFLCRSNCMRKALNVIASNCFSRRVTSRPSFTFTAPNKATDFRVGARSTTGSFSSGGTHIATLVPCCWKWHSSKLHKSTSFLFAKLRCFFKSLLFCRISMSNQRTRLSQTKSKLMKKPLTLPNTQRHLMPYLSMMRKKFPTCSANTRNPVAICAAHY